MSDLIPTVNWTDFQKVAKMGRLKELNSCEINFNSEHFFTFINPNTDYVKTQAEYLALKSNSVGGKTLEQIMETAHAVV